VKTRGVWGFRKRGKFLTIYNHYDSEPTALGLRVVKLVRKLSNAEISRYVDGVITVESADIPYSSVKHLLSMGTRRFIDSRLKTTRASAEECKLYDVFKYLSPTEVVEHDVNVFKDSTNFLYDGVFCEWGYLINLDDDTLEVYKGFNKDPNEAGRFVVINQEPTGSYSYGCRLNPDLKTKNERRAKKKFKNFSTP
jgi:hypothetical protein